MAEAAELAQLVAQLADLLRAARRCAARGAGSPSAARRRPASPGSRWRRARSASTALSTLAWPVIITTSVDFALLEVVDQLDALAVGQLQVGEQDVGLQARHAGCARRAASRPWRR